MVQFIAGGNSHSGYSSTPTSRVSIALGQATNKHLCCNHVGQWAVVYLRLSFVLVTAVEPFLSTRLVKCNSHMLKILTMDAVCLGGSLLSFAGGDGFVARMCLPLLPNTSVLVEPVFSLPLKSPPCHKLLPGKVYRNVSSNCHYLLPAAGDYLVLATARDGIPRISVVISGPSFGEEFCLFPL